MGRRGEPNVTGTWFQLILRGHPSVTFVQDDEDWRALEEIARRMLFWCGGAIHGVRCEENTMQFAVQLLHASIGVVALHLSRGYAMHLRRRRGIGGHVFKHFAGRPIDEPHLEKLVLWLHRPGAGCWTGDAAYLSPESSWITTHRVLEGLGRPEYARSEYRHRRLHPTDRELLDQFARSFVAPGGGRAAAQDGDSASPQSGSRHTREEIVRAVALHTQVPYEDMRSASRRRTVTRAKAIVAVLATRNGISVAAVARFFRRSRSTMVEQAEYYRERRPLMFDEAARFLASLR